MGPPGVGGAERGEGLRSISIVVATHNRRERLRRLIGAVDRLDTDGIEAELVIVDDGSVDDTGELLDRLGDALSSGMGVTILRRAEAAGPARARDDGWRASKGEVVAFTDDDCEPTPGWLRAGLEELGEGGQWIAQGMTLPNPAEAGESGPFSRTIEVRELDPGFQTANMFYPRAALTQLDGFDTEAFDRSPGGEDADLGWRAIEAGFDAVFCEDAVVHHAVNPLGAVGKLRVAARWATPMRAYVRHPGLRRAHFYDRVFWKGSHRWLVEAAIGLLLTRTRLGPLGLLGCLRYARMLRARAIVEDGGMRRFALLAPYFLAHDLVEISSALRASRRYRRLMI